MGETFEIRDKDRLRRRRTESVLTNEELFYALLRAETEDEVDSVLKQTGLWETDPSVWVPYGGKENENNVGHINGLQAEATGAVVEKVINSIDAVLMRECWKLGIDPQSAEAPGSMVEAAERFFGIKSGRLENVSVPRIREIAEDTYLVATGTRQDPNYLIIDSGEGQTPMMMPQTICSLSKSNKIRIHFVQGKYNSGGAGILPFCGERKYQLVISRRCPFAPPLASDATRNLWGFTLMRLRLPGPSEKVASYVYLAPDGRVPTFSRKSIFVLPSETGARKALKPYAGPLEYGTCIKLYAYRWRKKALSGLITLDLRYELDRYLHSPCLPFYVAETRDYRAHSHKTPFKGLSATLIENHENLEEGFPDSGYLRIPGVGSLSIRVVVFKHLDKEGKLVSADSENRKRAGVFFLVNGQTHCQEGPEFVSRSVGFNHAGKFTMVAVDCSEMEKGLLSFFFMTSRDRARGTREYDRVMGELRDYLRKHEGLREIDNKIHSEKVQAATSEDQPAKILETLISREPAFAALLPIGSRIRTPFGGGDAEGKKELKKFPTFFKIAKEPVAGLKKRCPENGWCRVEFETDVVNDYFLRADMPGSIRYEPEGVCRGDGPLWEGEYPVRFQPLPGSKQGDIMPVTVIVSDERMIEPMISRFDLVVEKAEEPRTRPPSGHTPRKSTVGEAGLPDIKEIRRDGWGKMDPEFKQFSALRMEGGTDDKPLEFWVNMDNVHLLNCCKDERNEDNVRLAKYAFKYGLVFSALGMFREWQRLSKDKNGNGDAPSLGDQDIYDYIEYSMAGLARVIVPLIRHLARGDREVNGVDAG